MKSFHHLSVITQTLDALSQAADALELAPESDVRRDLPAMARLIGAEALRLHGLVRDFETEKAKPQAPKHLAFTENDSFSERARKLGCWDGAGGQPRKSWTELFAAIGSDYEPPLTEVYGGAYDCGQGLRNGPAKTKTKDVCPNCGPPVDDTDDGCGCPEAGEG